MEICDAIFWAITRFSPDKINRYCRRKIDQSFFFTYYILRRVEMNTDARGTRRALEVLFNLRSIIALSYISVTFLIVSLTIEHKFSIPVFNYTIDP